MAKSIYIHIPFCNNICSYCDFPKVLYDKKYIRKYLDTIKEEILERYQNEEVVSIYIGGGTPTSLDEEELKYLLEIISVFKKNNNIEFSIESNIECLTNKKIKLFTHSFRGNRNLIRLRAVRRILYELHILLMEE